MLVKSSKHSSYFIRNKYIFSLKFKKRSFFSLNKYSLVLPRKVHKFDGIQLLFCVHFKTNIKQQLDSNKAPPTQVFSIFILPLVDQSHCTV